MEKNIENIVEIQTKKLSALTLKVTHLPVTNVMFPFPNRKVKIGGSRETGKEIDARQTGERE